jgi:two-component system response regulator HydG
VFSGVFMASAIRAVSQRQYSASGLSLLMVSQDTWMRAGCKGVAEELGFSVHTADTSVAALLHLASHAVDAVLLELGQDQAEALQLLERIKKLRPECEFIMAELQANGESLSAVQKSAVFEFVRKPFHTGELKAVLERMTVHLRTRGAASPRAGASGNGSATLITQSLELQKLLRMLPTLGSSRRPVLITGERGTGKEALARTIHSAAAEASGRAFVRIDCASPSQELIEADLFAEDRPGGATLFLHEVSALPLGLQGKLVRALQEQEVHRSSKSVSLRLDSRLIASTRVDLEPACRQGTFRRDLCVRLKVVTLRIPPLRERREDIPLVVRHVLGQISAENARSYAISNQAMKLLLLHEWPGNVTELEGCLRSAAALAAGTEIQVQELPAYLQPAFRSPVPDSAQNVTEIVPLAEVEKNTIMGALQRLNGDKMATARRLGIGKTTLYRKLREYGIADQWITRPPNH